MRRYAAYLFDLYGTLCDIHADEQMPALWRRMAAFYGAHGAEWSPGALKAAYFDGVRAAEEALRARFDYPEADVLPIFAALFRDPGVQAGDPRAYQAARVFREASLTRLRAYAGAGELLDALHGAGAKVFLLSNAQSAFTMPEIDEIGLAERFDRIYISSDYGCKKPDPRFFRALLDTQKLAPEDCLMIGNDPVCDIGGARGVGMDGFYIHCALSPKWPEGGVRAAGVQLGMDLRAVRRALLSGRR